MSVVYTDEIHLAILSAYADPYDRIAAAVLALALKDSASDHPMLALAARKWLEAQGKSWVDALGLPRTFLRRLEPVRTTKEHIDGH
jgi:hypothetical protein